ncbi:MAG TPA: DUF1579 domain-containing protein [Ignavibacteriaceae bacterium]|nr:DUF1579 domain-containing protein [Ignavibacteriaceae bacterium]
MKLSAVLFSAFLFLVLSNSALFSQDMDAQQKAWMEYMTPGKYHEMMAKTVGEWKTVIKWWMSPGSEPMVSEGTAVNEMIMGGRYLKSTHTSTMMGQPFEGMMVQGYDNAKKEFVSTWIDNMGTGITSAVGKYDEAAQTITFEGLMIDPSTGADLKYKQILKIIDQNKQVMEMYNLSNGNEVKTMEIELTRKQS